MSWPVVPADQLVEEARRRVETATDAVEVRLVASGLCSAFDAVLKLHAATELSTGTKACAACIDPPYPCRTVAAISDALACVLTP